MLVAGYHDGMSIVWYVTVWFRGDCFPQMCVWEIIRVDEKSMALLKLKLWGVSGWHLLTPTFVWRGRRGTYDTGLALVVRLGAVSRPWRHGTLRGRRGTWRHRHSICMAGVALGDIDVSFAWHIHAASESISLKYDFVTHNLVTHNFVTHNLSHISLACNFITHSFVRHNSFAHTAFTHTHISHTHNFVTHNFVTHTRTRTHTIFHTHTSLSHATSLSLSHPSLSHTTVSHTHSFTHSFVTNNFVTHNSFTHNFGTQSFTHNFDTHTQPFTHNVSHTHNFVTHNSSHTTFKIIDPPPSHLSFLLSPCRFNHFLWLLEEVALWGYSGPLIFDRFSRERLSAGFFQ